MKRLFCISALIVCMLAGLLFSGGMTNHAMAAETGEDYYSAGDIVLIGSYPQTRVTDTSLIESLKKAVAGKPFKKYPYTSRNKDFDFEYGTFRMVRNYDMMSYFDFTYGGTRYRAVTINEYRPPYCWGDPGVDSYQPNNGYKKGETYFFKWEPIEWIVLDPKEGLVLSRYGLDAQAFCEWFKHGNYGAYVPRLNSDSIASDYMAATIREWLTVPIGASEVYENYNFIYSAFSETELSVIKETKLKGDYTSGYYPNRVFLLSKDEFTTYKTVAGVTTDGRSTDYAQSQGSAGAKGTQFMWTLRSAASKESRILVAHGTGTGDTNTNFATVDSVLSGIRPAMKVDLTSLAVKPSNLFAISINRDRKYPDIRWSNTEIPNVTQYVVYRCDKGKDVTVEANWKKVKTLDSTATSCYDMATESEKTYIYRVEAVTSSRKYRSNTVTGYCKLSSPRITYTYDNSQSGKPVLSWTDVGASKYQVLRSLNGSGNWKLLAKTEGLTFTDETAEPATTYYYMIVAMSNYSSYYYSAKTSDIVKCIPCRLAAPVIKELVMEEGALPTIRWDPVPGASYYIIGVAYPGEYSTPIGTASDYETSYIHYDAPLGKKLCYYISAHSSEGYDYSSEQRYSKLITWTLPEPVIKGQPTNATVAVGETVNFNVSAKGMPTLSYQWQYKAPGSSTWTNSTQTGATTETLSVTTNVNHNGYQYRCIVKDGNGNSTPSNAAKLTVTPKITTHPVSKTFKAGNTVTFTVAATGKATLKYQWQCKAPGATTWTNSTQTGATTAKLSVKTNTNHDGYQYRCVVTDGNGKTATSNVAKLTLSPKITKQPANKTVTVGDAAEFTVTATGKATLKYQWQCKAPGSTTWTNSTQSGANTSKLTVSTTVNHNGYQYRCRVTDGDNNSTYSNPATLTVKPKITTQPKSKTASAGTKATFTVAATGKGTLTYQWQYKAPGSSEWNNSTQSGAKTATLKVNVTAAHNGYQYRCVVTDGNKKTATSNTAKLTVN